jgi:hypothetical protein
MKRALVGLTIIFGINANADRTLECYGWRGLSSYNIKANIKGPQELADIHYIEAVHDDTDGQNDVIIYSDNGRFVKNDAFLSIMVPNLSAEVQFNLESIDLEKVEAEKEIAGQFVFPKSESSVRVPCKVIYR